MRRTHLGWTLAFAAACVPAASACAMSSPVDSGRCKVINGTNLPRAAGDASAVCATFENALSTDAAGVPYDKLELRVLSKSAMVATVYRGGTSLAKQHFSVMDRNLNPDSIKRFAQSLAIEVAKAKKS